MRASYWNIGIKAFTDTTHADHHLMPPQEPRSFSSFDEAAEEAAVSRLYRGIHFSFDNGDGLSAGLARGKRVENSKTLELGKEGKRPIAQVKGAGTARKKLHGACSRGCRRKAIQSCRRCEMRWLFICKASIVARPLAVSPRRRIPSALQAKCLVHCCRRG
jgi:hypothetical protein